MCSALGVERLAPLRVPHHDVGVGADAQVALGRPQPERARRAPRRRAAPSRRAVMRPAATPSHTSPRRVSMPGRPPGISVKSAQPLGSARAYPARRSATVNGQWSVATVCTAPVAMPCHSSSTCHGSRSGGVHTNDSPSGPVEARGVEVEVLRARLRDARRRRARAPRAPRPARAPTTGARRTRDAPATSASAAARLHGLGFEHRRAGCAACSSTPVRPSASAWRRSASIAPPFSQCSVTSPPWRAAAVMMSTITSSSTCSSSGYAM